MALTRKQLRAELERNNKLNRKERTEDLLINNINNNDKIGDIIQDFHFKDRADKEELEKSWKWQFKQLFTPKKVLLALFYVGAIITASYFAEDIENIKILFDIINVFN